VTRPFGFERPKEPRRGRWTVEEVEWFKELWGLRDEETIARELGRLPESLRRMARKVFDGPVRTGPWSAEEVLRLKQYIGGSRLQTIAQVFSRSVEDLRTKLAQLAVDVSNDPLDQEEQATFKRVFGTRTDEDLALIFGRRLDVIRETAKELCLSKDKGFLRREGDGDEPTRMPRWTPEDLEILATLYASVSNLEIARRLDRSVKSVVSKANHMGFYKDPARLQEMGRENVARRHGHSEDGPENGAADGDRRDDDASEGGAALSADG